MRLEGRKADLIRSLIALKRRELEDVCCASHMPVPPQPEVDASVEAQGGAAASAQVTNLEMHLRDTCCMLYISQQRCRQCGGLCPLMLYKSQVSA